MTKEKFIADVVLQLFNSAPSDDLEVELEQIADWGSYHRNQLVANEINSKTARDESIPSIYIDIVQCEVGEEEETDCTDGCENRIAFELPQEVMTLNNDAGIVYVETSEGESIHRMKVETLSIVRKLRYAKPSESNLLYFRQGKKIYVEGMKPVDIPFDKLTIYYVPQIDISALDDEDELKVSDLVYPLLIDAVVSRGRLQFYGTQSDQLNNGNPDITPVYHQQVKKIETEDNN